MRCPTCSTELPDSAKFCLECGSPVARVTARGAEPAIYTPRHLAERILTTRSALVGERKQVTVLFCDLANSTPLAERLGPERMHALLNGFFELAMGEVHRYEGTINQFLGDGFMALFGAPLTHEDDARRAALAAVAIRRTLRDRGSYFGAGADLAVRIGINTGLVVVGSIGDNLRMDYTAVGDTTNVAARLQQIADPGTILVSEPTARLVRGDVRLASAGLLTVKGKAEPVVAYKVLGRAPARSTLDRAAERAFGRFVGRGEELRTLNALLARAQAGEGHVVGIVGEAGSGKSRLLYELRQSLGGLEVTCLEGRCRSYGTAVPYLPIADLVRAQSGIAESDTPEAMAGKITGTLRGLGLDADERAPYLMMLLGLKDGAEALADVSPEGVRARTVDTLRAMFLESSRRRPLLLVVEDLHWIDAPSEEYLTRLVQSLEDSAILIIGTSRPGYAMKWGECGPPECITEIVLRPLAADDSLALVRSVVQRQPLSDSLLRAILDKAGGNPLFLEELTRAVGHAGATRADVAVPETLQGVLMARIDALPDVLKRVLQTASVLGREFSGRVLEALWDGPGTVPAHLVELERLDFVHEQRVDEETAYAFNHALMQEVAYETLLTPSRQALHEAAAAALERIHAGRLERVQDRLAFHWSRTPNAAKAVEYLARVGDAAMRAYANAEAVAAFGEAERHAARLPDGERVRLELLLRRSQALFLLARFRESLDALEAEAAAVARVNVLRLTSHYEFRVASAVGILGDPVRASEHARRAIETATAAGDPAMVGRGHYLLAREAFWAGELEAGVEHGRRAVALLAEQPDERWWLSMAHWAMGLNSALLGRFDEALASASWAQAAGDKLGDPRLVSNAAWLSGWVHATRGDWATGIEAGKRSLAQAPDEFSQALSMGFLGNAYLEKGDHATARPLVERAAEMFRRFNFPQLAGWFTVFLGRAHLLSGDLEAAESLVRRALDTARGVRFWPVLAAAHRVLAAIARARGDLATSAVELEHALDQLAAFGARFEHARAQLEMAETEHARGRHAPAARHLAAAHTTFETVGAPIHAARARDTAAKWGLALAEA